MNKLEKIQSYEIDTGEIVTEEMIRGIVSEEHISNIIRIFRTIEKGLLDDLTLEDMELAMATKKIDSNIKIDLRRKNDKYFIISSNRQLTKDLSSHTKSLLWDLSQMITFDNSIVMDNNKPIENYKMLCEYLNINYATFKRHIVPDINKYNIVKKEKIRNNMYLVLNPLFSIRNRSISEYMFKCFYKELKEYLHPIEYLYLVKLHGIDPSKVYIGTKHEKIALL